ncbi:MAG: glyoxylase-like metal-dependent hydrolase (beta-lactamase superfamily II) [Candidatus Omnitrophota bacterium]|jgi:glyoxylase-like metal-dependent hydrolase (beta-lactamase superfamily II)
MKVLISLFLLTLSATAEQLSPHLVFIPGAVNEVRVGPDAFSVYRGPSDRPLLLTHYRRDVVGTPEQKVIFAPAADRERLENADAFWVDFETRHTSDTRGRTTKVLGAPLEVMHWLEDGNHPHIGGYSVEVMSTPGFTRGACSYLIEIDDQKVAFTGDLIYGDGQILDLYSFQDEIPEAKIGGYHGYAARLAQLVESLHGLKLRKPDLIVPARGPVIRNPAEAIDRLTARAQALYKNYLSTNALHWYFKEERMQICGERVLGTKRIELMPYALHVDTPEWIYETSTSRLLISDDGYGFLLDCGYDRVIEAVQKLIDQGLVKKVEGIFTTHYHGDHTDRIQKASEQFGCPVYATTEYEDVLEHPEAYHLAAGTKFPIHDVTGLKSGTVMPWRGMDLTFQHYPGQTWYHGALLVKKPGEPTVFFVGDAFAPSGLDDYCLLNRNLLHEDSGYLYCMKQLRALPADAWIVNQHIPHLFRFSEKELDFLERTYRERIAIQRDLFPWDDPNYGVDEQWAVFYPRVVTLKPGETRELELRVINHSPVARTYQLTPHASGALKLVSDAASLTLPSRGEGMVRVKVEAPAEPGHYLLTSDVESAGMSFEHWSDALIVVK